MRRPHENTYWLEPNRILAGEYPASRELAETMERLRQYLDCGITDFLDLTSPGELDSYETELAQAAAAAGIEVSYRRFPIRDMDVPENPADMTRILDEIERRVDAGGTVYVHCWGGIGRTGTVAGCYLVRHGLTGDAALHQLARLWPQMHKSGWFPTTPQTLQQFEYVRHWRDR
jgi:protein tyrosine/serine phosphatase